MNGLNFDLFSVGVASAGIAILGFVIFFSNPKSVTNRTFLAFSITTVLWSMANYLQYQPSSPAIGLWIVRIIAFLGCWHAYFFFRLCAVFPKESAIFGKVHYYAILPLVAFTSLLTLTPLIFSRVSSVDSAGVVTAIDNGSAFVLFGLLTFALITSGIIIFARKAYKERGLARRQIAVVGLGMLGTFFCILTFNLVLPAFYNNAQFLPLSAVFMFPFIAATAHSIIRYGLLNIKVVAVETLAFLLSTATAVQVLFSHSPIELLFRVSVFGLVLAFSILMIRSVLKEVQLRETIEAQEKELELANRQQESFLHFMSHEIKGHFTRSVVAFSGILDGDFGETTPELRTVAAAVLADMRNGVATIMDILEAANLKRGTMSIAKKPFDFRSAVVTLVEQSKPAAEKKHLALSAVLGADSFTVLGDEEKVRRHIIRNLVDNAITYTQHGQIAIDLTRTGTTLRFSVKDSGVGITPEDMQRLFTEGGRGKDSLKINTHSTGYGLAIARQIVEAHGGKIWAESEGQGKGSRFVVELPVYSGTM